ncbi:Zinc finger protein Xfin [Amphibalanus amphitrite]|uniref:Zinc finger protein Xfin n=1 Tax=Amphibalanus amphitrite TaxID=1232801 RepID=A0A6A4VCA1_AMPAM|nr:Zinc finger protein Xfin [Amphibalanus amphitrite]
MQGRLMTLPPTAVVPRWFSCDRCEQTFTSKSSLWHHQAVHRGQTRCSLCGKVYSRRSVLAAHIANHHSGQRAAATAGHPAQRPAPQQRAASAAQPAAGQQVPPAAAGPPRELLSFPGGELGFCLPLPPMPSAQLPHGARPPPAASLVQPSPQRVSQPKQHVCAECGRAFAFRDSLTHHMSLHRGETTCPVCHKVLSRKAYLRTHLSTAHGMERLPPDTAGR